LISQKKKEKKKEKKEDSTMSVLKCFFTKIYQNNIFFIFQKLFLTLAHQNNLKTQKIY
jgi:hypothetical protein